MFGNNFSKPWKKKQAVAQLPAVAVGDGHAPVAAEGLRRDLDAGRALAAFIFAEVDQSNGFQNSGFIKVRGKHGINAHVFFNIGFEDRVEHFVGRERIGVLLIGSKLRRGRALNRRGRNGEALFVSPAAEIEHECFGNVFDDGEAAGHIAIEGAVADRDFAFVS